ncbi:MAG: endopeptidase La [bacterium]
MADRTKKKLSTVGPAVLEGRVLPFIPLRDTVIFPRVAMPIVVKRERSVQALNEAMRHGRTVVLAAQRNSGAEDPSPEEIRAVGTLAKVRELIKQDDGTVRVLVEGESRVRLESVSVGSHGLSASVSVIPDPDGARTERVEALTYSVLNHFRRVVGMGASVSFDVLLVILNMSDPWLLGDLIASNVEFSVDEKQAILESASVEEKLELVSQALARQVKILQMASKIQADTGKELDKMQREVFLREQLKSIEKELEGLGGRTDDEGLEERLMSAGLPDAVRERGLKEYRRLQAMPSFSPETSYVRSYLEWLCDLPWSVRDECDIDIVRSRERLDRDHHGLEKVKERVLEYLAVQQLSGRRGGTLLCFVGPPGTGKTSIGRSIAGAMGRRFHRLSLGGVRDEAEIRGHRRTYVGALPGRILQGLATVGSRNPVFMLDEIDKLGADFRGDPSAALLEVLDPEQNSEFSDHYLEVPFDLSEVMFITTANMLDTIPPALYDRLEVVEFPGYTEREKLQIAKGYLMPRSVKASGLPGRAARLSDDALRTLVRSYTREAGVRGLEREIGAVCRKLAKATLEGQSVPQPVRSDDLERLLGPRRYSHTEASEGDAVGVVNGLAWTEAGGEILQIEATLMPGRGRLILTGQLGDVMQESARAAFSFVRSAAERLGLDSSFHRSHDVHIHVPAGATPKDGPSAGVAMAVALVSLLGGNRVDCRVGVTGEITLRGRVLEIGGVKEKCLAAHRAGLRRVVMPAGNRRDLAEVPSEVRDQMEFVFVRDVTEALPLLIRPGAVPNGKRRDVRKRKVRRS